MAEGQSFTFEIAAPVQATAPQAPAPALFGFSGNASSPAVPLAQGPDMRGDNSGKTIDFLMKLGSNILAPHVAAARQQKAAEGMVAAMQGMSAASIQDGELLGNLFGDSVTVAAARQVEQMDAVNKFSVSLAENMQDIRKMSPQEFRSWYPQQMQQFSTGDPQSDAMITQAFMERMPQTVDMHIKAHTQYRQEVAEQAWSNDLNTWGSALLRDHEAAAKQQLSPDLLNKTKADFAARLAGPGGISTSEYPKWINRAYKRFAADGNLAALKIIEETGVLEATQTDDQYAALIKARDASENKMSSRYPSLLTLASDRGTIEFHIDNGSSVFNSPEEVMQWADSYNRDFMDTYGGSKPPLTIETVGNLVERWHEGRAKAEGRNARAGALSDNDAVLAHYTNILNGQAILSKGIDGIGAVQQRTAQDMAFRNFADKPAELARLIEKDDAEWPVVQSVIAPATELLRNGVVSERAIQGMSFIAQMAAAGGERVIGRYLKEDAGVAMALLDLGGLQAEPEKLVELSKQLRVDKWARKPPEELAAMEAAIYDASDKGLWNTVKSLFGAGEYANFQMTDGGRRLLANILAPYAAMAAHGTTRDPDRAAKVAMGMIEGQIDIVAGIPTLAPRLDTGSARTMASAVNALVKPDPITGKRAPISQGSENYQRAVNNVIEGKIRARVAAGEMPPSVYGTFGGAPVAERADWNGSKMYIDMVGNDGHPITVDVTPAEVYQALQSVQSIAPVLPAAAVSSTPQALLRTPVPSDSPLPRGFGGFTQQPY